MKGSLRNAGYLGASGACAMLVFTCYAVWQGDFQAEGRRILGMAWGRTALLDVYVGLALFCGWIFFRERGRFAACAWTFAIIVTGNLATCCYVLWAVVTSRGMPTKFWMGVNHET